MNDNYGWTKNNNINGCNEKNIKYKEMIEIKTYCCWYGYYKTYPWMRKNYEINMWFAGGTISMVQQQQQQGSTSRFSNAGRWSTPILSS
jgi:hypothetical protein